MSVMPHISQINEHFFAKKRDDFPILRQNPDAVYFDSASTTQKPDAVMHAVQTFYQNAHANPGRGMYDWAQQTDRLVQEVRRKVASFVGAPDAGGVVFTQGTTMSLNMVAQSWGAHNLQDGDEVLYCPLDHSAMALPWVYLQKQLAESGKNIVLKPYKLSTDGEIDYDHLLSLVGPRTKIVNITHIHNVAGVLNDVEKLRAALPEHVVINLDSAQSVSHMAIDVEKLGVQFLSFSGHKMFSENGIGVLWVSPEMQESCRPWMSGGGMAVAGADSAFFQHMEAGTQNLSGIVSLGAAMDYINDIGRERIERHIQEMTFQLYQGLIRNPRVDMIFPVKEYDLHKKQGIAAFHVEGYEDHEIGDFLCDSGFYIRYGQHCSGAEVLQGNGQGLQNSVRVSLHIYNTMDDIARLHDVIAEIE